MAEFEDEKGGVGHITLAIHKLKTRSDDEFPWREYSCHVAIRNFRRRNDLIKDVKRTHAPISVFSFQTLNSRLGF